MLIIKSRSDKTGTIMIQSLFFSFLIVLFIVIDVDAAILRGRLVRMVGGIQYPAPYLPVTILGALGESTPSYTGPDGMYYIYNVPPGEYTLRIWSDGFRAPTAAFPLHFTLPDRYYFDIIPLIAP
jgi:hypothetical protein